MMGAMTSVWFWIAVAVLMVISLYYLIITCPRCRYRLYWTDLGMEPQKRWVCFHCDYEQRIHGMNSSPEWQAWHEYGRPYYEKPHIHIRENGGVEMRDLEKVYFDPRKFERARDRLMKKKP